MLTGIYRAHNPSYGSLITTGHGTCYFMYYFNSSESIQHCDHLVIENQHAYRNPSLNRWSFTLEWSEANEGEVPFPMILHRKTLRGQKHPSKTVSSPNAVSMLAHRLRRWPSIETALDERPVFAGMIFGCTKWGLNPHDSQQL